MPLHDPPGNPYSPAEHRGALGFLLFCLSLMALIVFCLWCGGCAGLVRQVQGDIESVAPECSTESAITFCQCTARVLRDRACQRARSSGHSLPPACRDDAPASQPGGSR